LEKDESYKELDDKVKVSNKGIATTMYIVDEYSTFALIEWFNMALVCLGCRGYGTNQWHMSLLMYG
jgi:hypothetical protein